MLTLGLWFEVVPILPLKVLNRGCSVPGQAVWVNIGLIDESSVGGSQGPFRSRASQSHIREVSGTDSSLPALKSVTQLICCVYPLQKHLSPAGTAALMRKQKAIHTFILSFIHASILSE